MRAKNLDRVPCGIRHFDRTCKRYGPDGDTVDGPNVTLIGRADDSAVSVRLDSELHANCLPR